MVDRISRLVFGVAAGSLMLLAIGLVVYSIGVVVKSATTLDYVDLGESLLDAIGYLVIAIAVFDVSKFLLEEEVVHGRQMRNPGEARRSLTKFLSTITIAIFLEALVGIFDAGKKDVTLMLYPTLLLFGGICLVLGLGVFQKLSAGVEAEVADRDDQAEARDAQDRI